MLDNEKSISQHWVVVKFSFMKNICFITFSILSFCFFQIAELYAYDDQIVDHSIPPLACHCRADGKLYKWDKNSPNKNGELYFDKIEGLIFKTTSYRFRCLYSCTNPNNYTEIVEYIHSETISGKYKGGPDVAKLFHCTDAIREFVPIYEFQKPEDIAAFGKTEKIISYRPIEQGEMHAKKFKVKEIKQWAKQNNCL